MTRASEDKAGKDEATWARYRQTGSFFGGKVAVTNNSIAHALVGKSKAVPLLRLVHICFFNLYACTSVGMCMAS
jgi:hypothetical protein